MTLRWRSWKQKQTLLVVAPPIRSGIFSFLSSILFATVTISSKLGVIKPLRPMMSASSATAASKIFSHGVITPRSTTCVRRMSNVIALMELLWLVSSQTWYTLSQHNMLLLLYFSILGAFNVLPSLETHDEYWNSYGAHCTLQLP